MNRWFYFSFLPNNTAFNQFSWQRPWKNCIFSGSFEVDFLISVKWWKWRLVMVKWRVNEINLRNFTLNLNENLYLSIIEKRIQTKYLQNLRMVLSILCNDDNTCGNIPKLYCLIQCFMWKEPAGILGKLSSFTASY